MYLYKQKEDILLMPIFAMGLTMMFSLGSDVPPRGLVRCILGITFFIAIIVGHLILPMWRNSKSGVVSTEVKIGFWSALISFGSVSLTRYKTLPTLLFRLGHDLGVAV